MTSPYYSLLPGKHRTSLPFPFHGLGAFLFVILSIMITTLLGCARPQAVPDYQSAASAGEYSPQSITPVLVRKAAGHPFILTGTLDEKGNPVAIACALCHATKPVNANARLGVPLKQFHQSMVGAHGNLSCLSCHNPADGFGTLRLADGKIIPYAEAISLCAQCHGPQFRDYQHGAHGGMTGYWDLKKGTRLRNTCVDCHDPHAPKFPVVAPARGPNDRFQNGGGHD